MLIKGLDLGKKGKLYFTLIVAAAILTVALCAYTASASTLTAAQAIVNNNGTSIKRVLIANAIARAPVTLRSLNYYAK